MALLISAFEVQTSLSAAAVSHEEEEEEKEMSAVRCDALGAPPACWDGA